jgi:hypothetical protein
LPKFYHSKENRDLRKRSRDFLRLTPLPLLPTLAKRTNQLCRPADPNKGVFETQCSPPTPL